MTAEDIPADADSGDVQSLRARVRDLEDEAERRSKAEAILVAQRDLALELNATRELSEGVRMCLDAALAVSDMDCGGVYLFEPPSNDLALVHHRGLSGGFVKTSSRYRAESSQAKLVKTGDVVYTDYRELFASAGTMHGDEGLKAIAIVPIPHAGNIVGALNVASHSLEEVPERARSALEAIAAQAGGSIARLEAEKRVEESERRLKILFERAPDAIYMTDLTGTFVDGNMAAEEMIGYKRDELIGKSFLKLKLLPLRELAKAGALLAKNLLGMPTGPDELTLVRKDSTTVDVEIRTYPVKIEGRRLVLGVARNVTERAHAREEKEQLEEQLRHTQKMEAIGALAGGIAHDFNNMLSVILGYADLLLMDADPEGSAYSAATTIAQTAEKASALTRQLVGFARKGKMHNVTLDLHESIGSTISILERTIDKHIIISLELNASPSTVRGDPGQVDQVIMNLAMNARDAMPDGGRITIRTNNADLSEEFCRGHPSANPGTHVVVSVIDDGMGMSEDVARRVFEPFFTTKRIGEGTGLGLAMVYGIVTNHGGYIEVESAPGNGTTFDVYLPVETAGRRHRASTRISRPVRGSGTILVVDDEPGVRQMCDDMLTSLGYDVVLAADGKQATEIYAERGAEIDLVVLDMVMPVMDGPACFARLKELDDSVKVVLASGHVLDGVAQDLLDKGALRFIKKPFTSSRLSSAVSKALRVTDQ